MHIILIIIWPMANIDIFHSIFSFCSFSNFWYNSSLMISMALLRISSYFLLPVQKFTLWFSSWFCTTILETAKRIITFPCQSVAGFWLPSFLMHKKICCEPVSSKMNNTNQENWMFLLCHNKALKYQHISVLKGISPLWSEKKKEMS